VEPQQGDEKSSGPAPSLWPVGFAIGLVCLLVGLVVSWWAVAIGGIIALIFGVVWVHDLSSSSTEGAEPPEPPTKEDIAAHPALAAASDTERYPRDKFLEGATLGLGLVIGGLVTIPPLGMLTASSFEGQQFHKIDLGPLSDFPLNTFIITTFIEDVEAGEVSRRTAYIRNNGFLDKLPSLTILSNRCAHLGCPVQPNGPVDDTKTKKTTSQNGREVVIKTPAQPAGFGCPCHGGQYDTEGNRTAGPPVRALDRYTYAIVKGHVVLGGAFSVAKVEGTGKDAQIKKTRLHNPGQHVDGPEFWLWPVPEIRA
jgi:Rieske Fe-S protein